LQQRTNAAELAAAAAARSNIEAAAAKFSGDVREPNSLLSQAVAAASALEFSPAGGRQSILDAVLSSAKQIFNDLMRLNSLNERHAAPAPAPSNLENLHGGSTIVCSAPASSLPSDGTYFKHGVALSPSSSHSLASLPASITLAITPPTTSHAQDADASLQTQVPVCSHSSIASSSPSASASASASASEESVHEAQAPWCSAITPCAASAFRPTRVKFILFRVAAEQRRHRFGRHKCGFIESSDDAYITSTET
jgi:hypothetical protein